METIVDVETLRRLLSGDTPVLLDCRFTLADPGAGRRAYTQAHVPGAHYAHLDEDLSGAVVPGQTGRHPLPDAAAFVARLDAWGVRPGRQVVVYDDKGGAIASRAWWMLRSLGHRAVAVLDGGWPAWVRGGAPTTDAPTPSPPRVGLRLGHAFDGVVGVEEVEALGQGGQLFDARASERYRGEREPIDPVAGHVPGAHSLPFAGSLREDGRFRASTELAARFRGHLDRDRASGAAAYCGSGVTACHLLLAAEIAGFSGIRLYPGSWSHWVTDDARPVAVG